MSVIEIFPGEGKLARIVAIRNNLKREVLVKDSHQGFLHGRIEEVVVGRYKFQIANSEETRDLLEHDLKYLAVLE